MAATRPRRLPARAGRVGTSLRRRVATRTQSDRATADHRRDQQLRRRATPHVSTGFHRRRTSRAHLWQARRSSTSDLGQCSAIYGGGEGQSTAKAAPWPRSPPRAPPDAAPRAASPHPAAVRPRPCSCARTPTADGPATPTTTQPGTSCTCTGWATRSSRLPGGQSSGAHRASSRPPQGRRESPCFSWESTSTLAPEADPQPAPPSPWGRPLRCGSRGSHRRRPGLPGPGLSRWPAAAPKTAGAWASLRRWPSRRGVAAGA
jgi:hypothetical protein